jgi:hypothetical protein
MPPSIINEASMQTSVSAITRSMCAFDYGRSANAVANLLLEGGADADSKGNGYGQAPMLVPSIMPTMLAMRPILSAITKMSHSRLSTTEAASKLA